ncbi:myosin heavy chain-like protein [Trema orientale]|uniref:Myosin heavy chain-like protein n=1 Tax=Trema orientale TaxID=63057 RepID=A0A2P5CHW1_TREOI|nr:myosin heavy chain-like protein [Trema orientale]
MAIRQFLWLFLFPAFSSSLFALSETTTISENDNTGELRQIKLNIARLESKLEEISRNLNEKGLHIEEQDKLIEHMSHKIQLLQSTVLGLKSDERIKALEEEVHLLWAASRKSNFDIHVPESKAQDAQERLDLVASKAQKMADIVTEQWIQIQRLEQALQFTEFINKLFGDHLQNVHGVLDPYILQFKRVFAVAKEYHHELQRFIKREMEKYAFTAALANSELVFFMAYALITFPAWILLSSNMR